MENYDSHFNAMESENTQWEAAIDGYVKNR